ncbi:TrfB-related DNA-binding protein [Pseudomonas aeruginosa]|uniref:TrfB-related DNA-binding protein n=1 Tax=Pseudomonas aeruginosa TaxID=287 RepID=UPI003CC511FC
MQPIYTQAEWDQLAPALASRRLAIVTVEIAKAVLVEGKRIQDVAAERGITRQNAHAAVKRVRAIFEEMGASELIPVLVWLPPELAEQVKEMAKPYPQPASAKL